MHCQNCGQFNTQASNFCRFCGTKFTAMQNFNNNNNYNPLPNPAPANYENAPPRPYSWKTDEYQITDAKAAKNKTINRVQPLANFQQQPPPNAGLQTFQQSPALNQNFHCPRCNSNQYPRVTRQISTAGWIVFAVLLITFFPLFWIGFFIKEETRICPVCNFKFQ
jgi:RNA polymerase subunit RPABC4/transcription elongation factor Spt4